MSADETSQKAERLRANLASLLHPSEKLLVAYSGGIDSAYLAWVAGNVLGDRMLAVIADSPSLPRKELAAAMNFAQQHRIPLHVLATQEMDSAEYKRNDGSRCFHCKDELFRQMTSFAKNFGSSKLCYGRNVDDGGDFRPGQRAAEGHGVLAPLVEVGLNKQEIRALACEAGLSVWDKPAAACLASRIEYLREVTPEALAQVEAAEDHLYSLGFRQVRVRHHGELARIEVARSEMNRALSLSLLDDITAGVRAAGFRFVALDTSGYRTGSMNGLIPADVLRSQS